MNFNRTVFCVSIDLYVLALQGQVKRIKAAHQSFIQFVLYILNENDIIRKE